MNLFVVTWYYYYYDVLLLDWNSIIPAQRHVSNKLRTCTCNNNSEAAPDICNTIFTYDWKNSFPLKDGKLKNLKRRDWFYTKPKQLISQKTRCDYFGLYKNPRDWFFEKPKYGSVGFSINQTKWYFVIPFLVGFFNNRKWFHIGFKLKNQFWYFKILFLAESVLPICNATDMYCRHCDWG